MGCPKGIEREGDAVNIVHKPALYSLAELKA
jgi:hypothetical protein